MRHHHWNQYSDMEVLNISLVPRKKQNNSDLDIEMSSELISVRVYHEQELSS